MAVLRPRSRLVYFRVSEEEYDLFAGMCQSEGARSISDLARLALQHLAQHRAISPESRRDVRPVTCETVLLMNEALSELRQIRERLNSVAPESGTQAALTKTTG